MNAFKQWWDQNSSRDQMAILVLGICFLLFILYMGILKPIQEKRATQLNNNQSALNSLKNVRDMAALWTNRDASLSQNANQGSIVEIVDTSLRAHNLRLSGMQPSGLNDVRLRLDQARFDSLLEWLNEMEVSQGLQIKDLSVVTADEPGIVSVNMRLRRD